jgi:hypothetical protein
MKIKDEDILPDNKFWENIGFNPKRLMDSVSDATLEKNILNFKKKDMEILHKHVFKEEMPNYKMGGYAYHIMHDPDSFKMATLLNLLEKYSTLVNLNALNKTIEKNNIEDTKSSKRGLVLRLFIANPDSLRITRYRSMHSSKQKCLTQFIEIENGNDDLTDDDLREKLNKEIQNRMADTDKRAGIDRIDTDDDGTTHIYVKYEDKEHRVDEWDGSHWDKPRRWVIMSYNREEKRLETRLGTNKRKTDAIKALSTVFSGKDDSFTAKKIADLSKIDKLPSKKDEIPNVKIPVEWNVLEMKVEDIGIKNSPTIEMKGHNLNETIEELKNDYGLDIIKSGKLTSCKITATFEFEGVKYEAGCFLNQGREIDRWDTQLPPKIKAELEQLLLSKLK